MNETSLIAQTAEDLFADGCQPDRVLDAHGGWLPDLWATIEETGFSTISVADETGTSETTVVDAAGVVRIAARYAAPIPLAEHILAAHTLAAASLPVTRGPLTSAVAEEDFTVVSDGECWRLEGNLGRVAWARFASHVVVVDGLTGCGLVVPLNECRITPGSNIAGEPRDEVAVSVSVPNQAVSALSAEFRVLDWWRLGALLRSAQIVGAVDALLERTVRYVQERQQFGRPIRAFQAVQQELARLAGLAASMSAAVEAASVAWDRNEYSIAIAAAKSHTSRVSEEAVRIAHQLHGAIGMTSEYPLHLWSRRIWGWRDEFGDERHWASAIGRHLQEGTHELWDVVSDTSLHLND